MIRARLLGPIAASCWLCVLCAAPIAHAEMRVRSTEHYQIHTDLDQQLSDDLIVRMEAMYSQYTQRLADFKPKNATRFEVYLFARKKDYLALTDNKFPNTGGVFMPRRQILAAFLEEQGRDTLRRTLQHEAFHQFAFTAISPRLPVWLNEGIAQVYEEGIWTGKQFVLGQVPPRRIRQIQHDIKERRLVQFKEFISMSDETWQSEMKSTAAGAAHYSQAWAMTHFLVFAKDEAGNPRYRSRLIDMLKLIHAGKNGIDAFTETFSENFQGFQDRFLEYIRALTPTEEATYIEHQSILADMLVLLKDDGVRFSDIENFRAKMIDSGYRLRYTKGNVEWSTERDPGAYFRNLAGQLLSRDELFFSIRSGAPLPDLVCRPVQGTTYRTIFRDGIERGDRVDHETLIEAK